VEVLERLKEAVLRRDPVQESHFWELLGLPESAQALEEFLRFWDRMGRPPLLFSPVHEAVSKGVRAVLHLEKLREWGFSLEHAEGLLDPPVFFAVGAKDPRVLGYLLAQGVEVNLLSRSEGDTPLIRALAAGWAEGAGLLLDRGADPFLPDKGGSLPVHHLLSVWSYTHVDKRREAVLRLAQRLVPDGETLRRLRKERHIPPVLNALVPIPVPELVELALDRGIRPDDPGETQGGFSPLAQALHHGRLEAARSLLRFGLVGDPLVLARALVRGREVSILSALLERVFGTEAFDGVAREVLLSPWREGIEALLPYLLASREKVGDYLRLAVENPGLPSPHAVVRLAEAADREALEAAYGRLKQGGAARWALGALLGKDEGLEALKER